MDVNKDSIVKNNNNGNGENGKEMRLSTKELHNPADDSMHPAPGGATGDDIPDLIDFSGAAPGPAPAAAPAHAPANGDGNEQVAGNSLDLLTDGVVDHGVVPSEQPPATPTAAVPAPAPDPYNLFDEPTPTPTTQQQNHQPTLPLDSDVVDAFAKLSENATPDTSSKTCVTNNIVNPTNV